MHRPGEGTGMQEGYLLDARVRRGSTEMWARCQKSCLCRCICMQESVYCRHVSIQGAAQIKLRDWDEGVHQEKLQSEQDSVRVEATLVETECFKSGCYVTESR